jgi:CelD/BcsL family acetyltransferase involved in cellulose biosynthesis
LPFWLENVCRHVGAGGDPYILTVHNGREPIGIMPLCVDGAAAKFLGSHEVCDYQDMICAPGRQQQVMESAITHLADQGIRRLDLRTLRPEGLVLAALTSILQPPVENHLVPDEVTYETALPGSWEEFLLQLNAKQRHEVRRKLRRLESQARVGYRCIETVGSGDGDTEVFLTLFRRNRPDKAAFMTDAMENYFRCLIREAAHRNLLRLCFLDVNDEPAASVLCFDYHGTRYLYNSGYDEQFESMSVGVLSKVLSIHNAIDTGCRHYDFLKGAEVYKKRIGGNQTPLYRCTIDI